MARMMAYPVTVEKLDGIEGKDKIQYAHFKEHGYGVIVPIDYKVGDVVVYFEVDSILPCKDIFEFLKSRCYRENLKGYLIKNMKMFGLYSNGLTMTFERLGIKPYEVGKDLTNILKVRKFEIEEDASPKKQSWIKKFIWKFPLTRLFLKKVNTSTNRYFPSHLIEKSDEDNIQNKKGLFEKRDEAYITIKMEGCSVTVLIDPKSKKFEVYGRNTKAPEKIVSFFKTENFENKLKSALKDTGHYFALQGEFCSPSVQKGIYHNGDNFYVYTIKDLTNGKVLSFDEMTTFCYNYDIKTVPVYMSSIIITEQFKTIEDLQLLTEKLWFTVGIEDIDILNEDNCNFNKKDKSKFHRHEGLVVRAKDQSWSYKVKSNEYQLAGL